MLPWEDDPDLIGLYWSAFLGVKTKLLFNEFDDKINERAIEKKISIGELFDKTIKNFHSIIFMCMT